MKCSSRSSRLPDSVNGTMSDAAPTSEADDDNEAPTILENPEIIEPGDEPEAGGGESIEQPAKVMRVGAMMRTLLEELRQADLDESSRERLREIHETSINELSSALSPDLHDELTRLALPFSDDEIPSEAELRIAKAQLVGWLEGLVQGIQATLFAQQVAAQQQLANMRGPGQLPPGAPQPQPKPSNTPPPGGTYL